MKTPKILISILNWNNGEDTIKCIDSVLKQEYTSFEIVVVDNASSDDSVQKIAEAYPFIQLIQSKENTGYAGGHQLAVNYGLNKAFDIFWILNNDLIVQKNTLSEIIKIYNKNGEAIYGSVVLDLKDKSTIEFMGGWPIKNNQVDYTKKGNCYEGQRYENCVPDISHSHYSHVMGASMIIPYSVIRKYGFIDKSFFLYGEERDYCFRLKENNITSIIVYSSIVLHAGQKSTSTGKLPLLRTYYLNRNSAYFLWRHRKQSKKQAIKELEQNGAFLIILLKLYIKTRFKSYSSAMEQTYIHYYKLLGLFHFYVGIKGKTLKPENL